jgi:hypothetical protein
MLLSVIAEERFLGISTPPPPKKKRKKINSLYFDIFGIFIEKILEQ